MDGGKHPDIARQAGNELLASIDEGAVESVKGTEVTVEKKAIYLTTLATEALMAHEVTAAQGTSQSAQDTCTIKSSTPDLDTHPADREDVKLTTIASPPNELPPIRQHSPKLGLSNSTGAGPVVWQCATHAIRVGFQRVGNTVRSTRRLELIFDSIKALQYCTTRHPCEAKIP
jgi:hypothetical protein